MLNFKAMYQTIESQIKEQLDGAVHNVSREFRSEFRIENNLSEIKDLVLEDAPQSASRAVAAIIVPLIALYDYNVSKVRYFANVNDCPLIIELIDEEKPFDYHKDSTIYIAQSAEQYIENALVKRYERRMRRRSK